MTSNQIEKRYLIFRLFVIVENNKSCSNLLRQCDDRSQIILKEKDTFQKRGLIFE